MSGYYGQRGVVNRYWKRPKPRVYECNVRDAERMYQQSYKDYLEAKDSAAKKASADKLKAGDDYLARIGYKRSNNLMDTMPDSLNRDIFSFDRGDKSSYLNSSSSCSKRNEDDYLSGGTSLTKSYLRDRINKSPEMDTEIIDDRFQRIQKLRSELGLPSGPPAGPAGATSRVRFQTPAPAMESQTSRGPRNRQMSPEPRSRRGKTVAISDSYSFNTQSNGISEPKERNSDHFETKFSGERRKSSRFAGNSLANGDHNTALEDKYKVNGREPSYCNDDSGNRYSYKSSFKSKRQELNGDNEDTYKPYKYKNDSETKSFKASRKISDDTMNSIDDYDDDNLLSNIRKKFPTSEEILERIKKMDDDI